MTAELPANTLDLLPRYADAAASLRALVAAHLEHGDPLAILDDEASLLELEEAVLSARREATAPHYAAKNAIESAFRPVVKAIEQAREDVENWLKRWGAESLSEYGSVRVVHPDLTASTVWDYEVDDPQLVPREFLTIDEKAIERHIDKFGDAVPIPGVRVYRTIKLRRRPQK